MVTSGFCGVQNECFGFEMWISYSQLSYKIYVCLQSHKDEEIQTCPVYSNVDPQVSYTNII